MPLAFPKFGFKNPNRVEYEGINLDTIKRLWRRLASRLFHLQTSLPTAWPAKRSRENPRPWRIDCGR